MSDETDATGAVARVLIEHHGWGVTGERVRTSDVTVYGCRGCPAEIWRDEEHEGWTAPAMRARFAAHQAAMLAEVGLLRGPVDLQRDGYGPGYSTSDPALLVSGHRIDAVQTTSTSTTWYLRCLAPHKRCEPFQGKHIDEEA
jgi:hypothetical protein